MVDGALLDALEGVARHVRRSDKPFGGIQLVLSGAQPFHACGVHPGARVAVMQAAACPAWLPDKEPKLQNHQNCC